MAAPVVEVITRDNDPKKFFARLSDKGIRQFRERCERSLEFQNEPEQVGLLVEDATHILRLVATINGKREMVTFAYLNVQSLLPPGYKPAPYAELILLCGKYRFTHGSTEWKGSEVLIDKAMELAKVAGKTALRLQAMSTELYTEVYAEMGFEPVPGTYHEYEKQIPIGGGRLRLNVKRRRTQRNGRGRKHRQLRKLTTRRR